MKTMFTCPHCHKLVKDLPGHIARMHPDTPPEPNPGAKKLVLEVNPPETKEKPTPQAYHCVDCGATLTKGQANCPQCGKDLDWSQVE